MAGGERAQLRPPAAPQKAAPPSRPGAGGEKGTGNVTLRAILLGLVGAVLVSTVGYFVDHVAHLNRVVSGQFPIVVYGPLVLVALLINPLLNRLRRGWAFRRSELGVIIVAMLVACSIPSNSLLRYFTRTLVMPIHFNRAETAWRTDKLLEDLPPVILANEGRYDDRLVGGFITGLGTEGRRIGLAEVPWESFSKALTFWGAVIVLFAVASICLALIVHPQWSRRERLRYPIAEFANILIDSGAPDGRRAIFRRGAFWIGLGALLIFHVVNGLYAWKLVAVQIPRQFDFPQIFQAFPWLRRGQGSMVIGNPRIWPMAVALAFFLASDVTFSVGICQPLATLLIVALMALGLFKQGGNFITGQPFHWQRAGSCMALAATLLYFGRHYYWGVLKSALTFRPAGEGIDRHCVTACRILLLSLAALTVVLVVAAELPWPLAAGFVMLVMLGYLAVARITAELGIYYVQIVWYPVAVLLGVFGAQAMGPAALVTLGVMCIIFAAQPEESLMAFVVQGQRVAERQRIAPGRAGWVAAVAFGLALVAGVTVALWVDYNYGGAGGSSPSWDYRWLQIQPYQTLKSVKTDLRNSGQLEASRSMTSWQRIGSIRPDSTFLVWTGFGLAAVLGTYAIRLRWHWWPIHPVMFLIWETWASAMFFQSFLLAWILQLAVRRIGSSRSYNVAKTVMVGVVAGELLGGMLWMIVGGIYYAVTNQNPPYYNIFPW